MATKRKPITPALRAERAPGGQAGARAAPKPKKPVVKAATTTIAQKVGAGEIKAQKGTGGGIPKARREYGDIKKIGEGGARKVAGKVVGKVVKGLGETAAPVALMQKTAKTTRKRFEQEQGRKPSGYVEKAYGIANAPTPASRRKMAENIVRGGPKVTKALKKSGEKLAAASKKVVRSR